MTCLKTYSRKKKSNSTTGCCGASDSASTNVQGKGAQAKAGVETIEGKGDVAIFCQLVLEACFDNLLGHSSPRRGFFFLQNVAPATYGQHTPWYLYSCEGRVYLCMSTLIAPLLTWTRGVHFALPQVAPEPDLLI